MADDNVQSRHCLDNQVLFPTQRTSICDFCAKSNSKYTCPRCNSRYCSSGCYKSEKHFQCSELFYKDCVLKAMSEKAGSPEERQKILEMLKKLDEDNEIPEGEEIEGIEERMAGIDINNDPQAVWSALTESERKDFESSIKNGEISSVINIWVPWWIEGKNAGDREHIEELTNNATKEGSASNEDAQNTMPKKEMPLIRKNIPPLSSLTRKATLNPDIQFSTINVLFSYSYVMRLYNGCPEDSVEQVAENIMQLSPVLSKNAVFNSVESAIYSSLDVVQHSTDIYCSSDFSYTTILDVISLIKGYIHREHHNVTFAESALSHTSRLLSKGRQKLKSGCPESERQGADFVKSLWLAKKKVEFLLSWVHSNVVALQCLVPQLQAVHAEISMTSKQHKEEKEKLKQSWGGLRPPKKPALITEI